MIRRPPRSTLFPSRRSSDLTYSITGGADAALFTINATTGALSFTSARDFETPTDADTNNSYVVTVTASDGTRTDRKSTRLNSSHSQISYAVFCLKKKINIGNEYLLGPIAAVVIVGASLAAGPALPPSLFDSSFFLSRLQHNTRSLRLYASLLTCS